MLEEFSSGHNKNSADRSAPLAQSSLSALEEQSKWIVGKIWNQKAKFNDPLHKLINQIAVCNKYQKNQK